MSEICGIPSPTNQGPQNHLFSTTSQLPGNFNGLFEVFAIIMLWSGTGCWHFAWRFSRRPTTFIFSKSFPPQPSAPSSGWSGIWPLVVWQSLAAIVYEESGTYCFNVSRSHLFSVDSSRVRSQSIIHTKNSQIMKSIQSNPTQSSPIQWVPMGASWRSCIQIQIGRLAIPVKSALKFKKYLLISPVFIELVLKMQWCQTVTFKSVQCHPGLTHILKLWHSGTLPLRAERQSARMSEINNVG